MSIVATVTKSFPFHQNFNFPFDELSIWWIRITVNHSSLAIWLNFLWDESEKREKRRLSLFQFENSLCKYHRGGDLWGILVDWAFDINSRVWLWPENFHSTHSVDGHRIRKEMPSVWRWSWNLTMLTMDSATMWSPLKCTLTETAMPDWHVGRREHSNQLFVVDVSIVLSSSDIFHADIIHNSSTRPDRIQLIWWENILHRRFVNFTLRCLVFRSFRYKTLFS